MTETLLTKWESFFFLLLTLSKLTHALCVLQSGFLWSEYECKIEKIYSNIIDDLEKSK